ncbi:putative amino acid transporter [Polyplosphaeria fusca]|uniref:Amino acid transporter n=1 Tax=Polyplosphaeria fusca TaxID=682080 RepID=A0A9P4RC53_9PLEO|nr:putative amino acid transporter [Polyplosphaeria fusca]
MPLQLRSWLALHDPTRRQASHLPSAIGHPPSPSSRISTSSELTPFARPSADAFGSEEGAAVKYKTCSWWHTGVLMIAENISLGILALPQAVSILGLVPGILLILILGIITFYTGYILGQFKNAFPQVVSYADMGLIVAGSWGYWLLWVAQSLILIFIMAAHVLSFSIAMNVLTDHSTCTTMFMIVGMFLCLILGLPRTMKGISLLSISACLSVVIAVMTALIAIAIAKPDMGNVVAITPNVPLLKGLNPVMNIVLAYSGHPGFIVFLAEMKAPRDYPKALAMMSILAITFYAIVGAVIYYFAGPSVGSPALASASPIVRKIAFGFAMPTIIIAGVVNGSVACKFVYVRVGKGTNLIHENNVKSWSIWIGIVAAAWVISWFIAEVIPNFNMLLGFIGALFSSWFCYGIPGGLWLYLNKEKLFATPQKMALAILNTSLILLGAVMCVLGLWASAHDLGRGAAGKVFSCDNNWSLSVVSH